MTRIAAVLIVVTSLNPWTARLSAQEALKTLTVPSRTHSVVRPTMDLQALRTMAVAAPWRPSLSTAPIAALPGRMSWNQSHTALAGAFVVTLLIDAAQTRSLARNGWSGFRESNPLLGERPSEGQINTYTALAGLGVLGAAAALPPRLRPWLLGAAIAVQAFTISGSVRQGIPITLP